MKKVNIKLAGVLIALGTAASAPAANVTMHTPMGYQILGLSPNGKWACGVYVDAAMNTFGFRWNLEGGSIEMCGAKPSTAWDVSNDGTVSGDFVDSEALDSGASINMPGYWRDGKWHHLETPEGRITDGFGAGISPDGHYMVGNICVNGRYNPYIWKDGKLHRDLSTGKDAVADAVSPDGNAATGFNTEYNRTACYWPAEGDLIMFEDAGQGSKGPWSYGRNFSPDGTKLVYWGGWDYHPATETTLEELFLYALYDILTGERIKIQAPDPHADLEFFDVTNSGSLVGACNSRGYITINGEGMYIDDYLNSLGVSLANFEDFYSGDDYYQNELPIYNIVAISEDEKVLAMQYYNTLGQPASMVLKIDHDTSLSAPAEVVARQLEGLKTVELKWKAPIGATGIRGYNVYRDGTKLNGFLPINVSNTSYYDKNLANGTYTYTVATVNTAGNENFCDNIEVEVTDGIIQAPYALFGRQKGVTSAMLKWEQPMSEMVHKRYYTLGSREIEAFGIYQPMTIEAAIRYTKNEMSQYEGYKISEVSFFPMAAQQAWNINLYTYEADGSLKLIGSQPVEEELSYGKLNTVKFDTPVDVPAGDLVVAVEVTTGESSQTVGVEQGPVNAGYSDLLRAKGDEDFFSCFESSLETGYSLTFMSWAIDCGLVSPEGEATSVSHYDVYADDEKVAETAERNITIAQTEGTHTYGVEAVYSDGAVSDRIATSFNIVPTFPGINDVDIAVDGTEVNAKWSAPLDEDLQNISYTSATKHSKGIRGNESNNYGMLVGSEYRGEMLRGLDGYQIKSFRFYPLGDAIFTFFLYENDVEICSVEVEDYEKGKWNEVAVEEPITINENATYRLLIDVFDPEPDTEMLAIDNAVTFEYLSDLFSTDNGASWKSLSYETGTSGNWMMGIHVVDPQAEEVEVSGYDIRIDNQKVNSETLTTPEFKYDFGSIDDSRHTLRVDVYYPARTEGVKGGINYFYLASSGVASNFVAVVTLRQGDNRLVAEGEGVEAMTLYTVSGMKVAEGRGNLVDITNLSSGIYMVQMSIDGKNVTRKIRINR